MPLTVWFVVACVEVGVWWGGLGCDDWLQGGSVKFSVCARYNLWLSRMDRFISCRFAGSCRYEG